MVTTPPAAALAVTITGNGRFGEAPAFGGQGQGIPHLYWVLALDNKFFLWISYRIVLTVFVSESSQPSQLWHTVTGDTRL